MVEPAPFPPVPRRRVRRWRPLSPRSLFLRRFSRYAAAASALIGGALLIGAIGYRMTEHMPWVDAVYSAAMILTGMGPTEPLKSDAGKIFATVYALLSSLVFLSAASLFLAPLVRRFLHRFHLEFEEDDVPPAPPFIEP